ncbi:MAG: hypothetical protein J6T17_06725 [Clostridia bacterium]|nr:hypothetical protein [Clostridia bacterium]
MSTQDLKQAEKEAAKAKKKAEKAARKAEKMKEKARRKALKDGTLGKAAVEEEPVLDGPDPLRPRTQEELNMELEELRDMVQGEIDEMREKAPDAEWDDIVRQALYEKQHGIKAEYHAPVMCAICGENEAAEDSEYCEACLDDMKHYPFEWWQFIIPLMAVFFLVFGILLAKDNVSLFKGVADAQGMARQGQLISALDKYGELNGRIAEGDDTYGFQYRKNQVKLLNRVGIQQYGVLDNYLNAYYPDDLNKWYNRYAAKSAERIEEYQQAYKYFEEAAQSSKDFKSLIKAFDKAVEGKDVNPAFANYYRYYATLIYGEGVETQKKYIDAIKAEGKEYESLYLPLEAEMALTSKDYDKALSVCDTLEDRNAEDVYADVYRTVAYRMKGDLKAAAAACDAGLKVDGTASTLNYQRAILFLLDGDLKLASAYAEEAHANAATANNYVSACSIYSLILQEQINDKTAAIKSAKKAEVKAKLRSERSDLKATLESLETEMEEYGYDVSPDVAKILSGKKTAEQVFLKGEGDFAW